MKLLGVIAFLVLLVGVLASVSNINLNPTGIYPQISTKGGLWVSITMLIYMLFAELGYLPYRFRGRKRRSAAGQVMGPLMSGDRDTVLKMIRMIDHRDCLLRYLCELEASRDEAMKNHTALDPALEADLFLLKVAKRKMHPALLMRQDPGSPALPFEVAVYTGSEGIEACATLFQTCPYNITTMQNFLGEDFSNELH